MLKALGTSSELKDIERQAKKDEVIATLLLHDMIKNGKGLNAQGYPFDRGVTGTHGVTLAAMIFDNGFETTVSGWQERVYYGVAGHMGIWTTNTAFSPNNLTDPTLKAFAQLIHLADYAASRKVDDIYRKLQGEQDGTTKIQTTEKRTSSCPGVREYKMAPLEIPRSK